MSYVPVIVVPTPLGPSSQSSDEETALVPDIQLAATNVILLI
jgi:hypothetical protein